MTHDEPIERFYMLTSGMDPLLTMAALWQGPSDPQMRLESDSASRAMRTPKGAASVSISRRAGGVLARAWGPGADAALETVPGLIGAQDDPTLLKPQHARVAELVRALPGLRMTRSRSVMDALVVSILGQKVTTIEAHRAFRALVIRYGEVAPGPLGLRLPPPPEKLAGLPYWAFHPLGVERRRADTIRAAAAVAPQLEAISRLTSEEGRRRLLSLSGVGEWTAAETMRLALGDPDAVSVGDFHLPRLICGALANETNGTDKRMLELLEPYRGQRARVALLIEHGSTHQQRRAPRMAIRSIAAI